MDKFTDSLNELLEDSGKNRLTLAKSLQIDPSTINGYFNNGINPHVNIAIKIAAYFGCSLDYLFCLTDSKQTKFTKPEKFDTIIFIQNIDSLLAEDKCSISKLMKDLQMGDKNYYHWKSGKIPKIGNLLSIANYFDVGLDWLICKH